MSEAESIGEVIGGHVRHMSNRETVQIKTSSGTGQVALCCLREREGIG